MSNWFRWENDEDTVIIINLDLVDTVNLYLDEDGGRVAMISVAQQGVSTTRNQDTITRLVRALSASVMLEEPWSWNT